MITNMTIKQRIFWLALIALGGILLIQTMPFDATADANGKPYSVSLNSPVTFPVDI